MSPLEDPCSPPLEIFDPSPGFLHHRGGVAFALIGEPFVGLRPFDVEDSHLFFGRREQTNELLQRLHRTRLVAAVGGSGCGKSSLVRAGLIPALEAGFLVAQRDAWEILKFKPGEDPLYNLAAELLPQGADIDSILSLAGQLRKAKARGVIEYLQPFLDENKNVLLLVDQFEETFLFGRRCGDEGRDKAAAFVSTLLTLTQKADLPIYVVITMRADFVGDCAAYPGFAEAMNRSLYLVPRLTRQQRREAIEGPIRMGGASISPRLLDRLLNESDMESDQLPVLQHALMRTWEEWRKDGAGDEDSQATLPERPIEVKHYELAGTLANALNAHAEEALQGSDLGLVRRIFQALTDTDSANRQIRRPARMSELQALTGAPRQAILEVIDRFQSDGRCFLILSRGATPQDPLIDVSHESLIRCWKRLKEWVVDEAESAETYRRLEVETARYLQGKAGLWHDEPGLQSTLDWLHSRSVNVAWTARVRASEIFQTPPWVRPTFEQTMEFLERSRAARDEEKAKRTTQEKELLLARERAEKLAQAQELARVREAQLSQAEELAREREEKLAQAQELAESRQRWIWRLKQVSTAACICALIALSFLVYFLYRWDHDSGVVKAAQMSRESKAIAQTDPQRSVLLAVEALALQPSDASVEDKEPENALRYALSIIGGRGLGAFRREISSLSPSPDGRALLIGSYDGTARLWALTAHGAELSSLDLISTSRKPKNDEKSPVLVGIAKNRIAIKDAAGALKIDGRSAPLPANISSPISAIALSPNGRWLVAGSQSGALWCYDLDKGPQASPIGLPAEHKSEILSVSVSDHGSWMVTLDRQRKMVLWQLRIDQPPVLVDAEAGVSALDVSDDDWLAVGSVDGYVSISRLDTAKALRGPKKWQKLGSNESIASIAIRSLGPDDEVGIPLVFVASQDGQISLFNRWDNGQAQRPRFFIRQVPVGSGQAQSVIIKVSRDGHWLAAAGNSLNLWSLDSLNFWIPEGRFGERTISLLGHSAPVTNMAFSSDNHWLITAGGGSDGTARIWDLTAPDPSMPTVRHRAHGLRSFLTALSPDFRWLVASAGASTLRCKIGASHEMDETLEEPNPLYAMKISGNGRWLVTESILDANQGPMGMRLWELGSEPGARLVKSEPDISAVDISSKADDSWLVTGGAKDGVVKMWALGPKGPLGEPRRLNVVPPESSQSGSLAPGIQTVVLTPDKSHLLVADYHGEARLCDLSATGGCTLIGKALDVAAAAASPNSRWIATIGKGYAVRVLDLRSFPVKPVAVQSKSSVTAFILGENNQLFVGAEDGTVSWYDLGLSRHAEYSPKFILADHHGPIVSLALSSDGRYLVTGGGDQVARLWDLKRLPSAVSGELPTILRGSAILPGGEGEGAIVKCLFSPDGKRVMTVSENGTARQWSIPDEELRKDAELAVGRNMFYKEWRAIFPSYWIFPGKAYRRIFSKLPPLGK